MSSKETAVCIECGTDVPMLYKSYDSAIIKLEQCRHCDKVADKYIEYENFVVLMDLVLQKVPAYRHILFNSELKAFWKFSIFSLVLDTYVKWVQVKGSNIDNLISELEWSFYFICLRTILEFGIYILIVIIYSYIGTRLCPSFFPRMKLNCLFNGLLLANFGQLLVIPTVIWGQSENLAYRRLTVVFIALSNIQAYKAVSGAARFSAVFGISLAFACRLWLSDILRIP